MGSDLKHTICGSIYDQFAGAHMLVPVIRNDLCFRSLPMRMWFLWSSYMIIAVSPDRSYRENTVWAVSLRDLLSVRADIIPVPQEDTIFPCCLPQ